MEKCESDDSECSSPEDVCIDSLCRDTCDETGKLTLKTTMQKVGLTSIKKPIVPVIVKVSLFVCQCFQFLLHMECALEELSV